MKKYLNRENNIRILKKLRKLIIADIKDFTKQEEFENSVCDLEEWFNEIESNIARLKKKSNFPIK